MKIDIGYCGSCNEKNSKFVEKCYKCGATLPWAAGYVAPSGGGGAQSSSAPAAIGPAPAPQIAPTVSSSSKTVVIPSASSPTSDSGTSPQNSDSAPPAAPTPSTPKSSGAKRVTSLNIKKLVPMAGWIVAGIMAISCAVLVVRGNSKSQTTAPSITTANGSGPATPTPQSTSTPQMASPVPTASPAATVSASTPPLAAPPSSPPAPALASVKAGPSFQEVSSHTVGDKSSQFTQAQEAAYWKNIVNTKITWTGTLVEAQDDSHITIRCDPQSVSANVSVTLDGTQPGKVIKFNKGQTISIVGILSGHNGTNYTVDSAQITN